MYNFYKNDLAIITQALTKQQAALFCIANCEKIIDMYKIIVDEYNIPNFSLIKEMSYYIWNNIHEYHPNTKLELLFKSINELVPDPDLYPGISNTIALNIIICLDISFKCITDVSNQSNLSGLYVYDTLRQCLLSKRSDIKYITADILDKIDQTSIVLKERDSELNILKLIDSKPLDSAMIKDIYNISLKMKYSYDDIIW